MVPRPSRRRRWSLRLRLVLLLAAFAPARAQQLPLQEFSSRDGLGSDFVSYAVEDSHGYMWFCTRDGLSRYDGHGFVNYGTEAGLPSSTVRFVLEARDETYWVATDGGVVQLDPFACAESGDPVRGARECSLFRSFDPGAPGAQAIHELPDGTILAGGPGLHALDPARPERGFQPVPIDARGEIERVSEMVAAVGDDGLWIATPTHLVRRFRDGATASFGFDPEGWQETTLLLDGDTLWLGTEIGLFALRSRPDTELRAMDGRSLEDIGEVRRYTTAEGLPHDRIGDLDKTTDGRLWIATARGLAALEAGTFRYYSSQGPGIPDLRPWALAADREGSLWLAGSGLFYFRTDGFVTYDQRAGLGDPFIRSIHEDRDGAIYVVTRDWEIGRLGETGFDTGLPGVPMAPGAPWMSQAAFLDSRGHWWLLADDALYRYPPNLEPSELARARPDVVLARGRELDGSPVRVYEDGRGDLWIATRRGGGLGSLLRRDRAGGLRVVSQADGLAHVREARAFAEDRAGGLWIGFNTGLVRLHEGRFRSSVVTERTPGRGVTDLHVDAAGRLWIATTAEGLRRIDEPTSDGPPRIRTYTTADGLASDNVRCLTEDRFGRIYVGTARGVDRLDPESGRIRHYARDDGLAGDFTTSAYRDRLGRLWFGTTRGLSSLEPRDDPPPPHLPARISRLRISGEPYRLPEVGAPEVGTLTLGPEQNRVEIEFHAAASEVRYQYRLEGANEGWSEPTTRRSVDFSSLAPGRYRFLVRSVAADGSVDGSPARVSFVIQPPLWQRWWFLGLAATVLGLGVWGAFRLRVRGLLELERVRTQIATDLHDDIGASLSQVAIVSEVARRQAGPEVGAIGTRLEEIAEISRGLVDSMSDIVWAINPQRDRVHDVTQRMRRFAADTLVAQGVELRFAAPATDGALSLGPELRREAYLVFKEALHNVVKHARCRSVEVEVAVDPDAFRLTVRDDGRGFAEAPGNGHGLASMARRAERLGGSLALETRPNEGTVVRLALPLRRGSRRHGRWATR